MQEFSIVEQLSDTQVKQLQDLFQRMWWSEGRTMDEIKVVLKKCMSFGIVENSTQRLIAYARVLTDEIKYAFIFDVMAVEQYRGKGLGKMLMKAIIEHPKLKNIKRFELTCKSEMMSFYEQFGFSEDYGDVKAMRYSRS